MHPTPDPSHLDWKREALLPFLRDFTTGYRKGLSPEELKAVNRTYQRLLKYEWPSKQFCPHYYHLGQFQHATLTLPQLDGREPVTPDQQVQLLNCVVTLIQEAAGPQYIPAFRVVPEYQAIDDRFDPFHLHVPLSVHRFKRTDQAAVQRLKPEQHLDPDVLERFFSVPPLLLTGPRYARLLQRWYHAIHQILGIRVPDDPGLVHVTFCRHLVQDADDRQRLGHYHRDTLKELKGGIEFQYRRRKRDFRVVSSTGRDRSPYFMYVPDFVRRYVALPQLVRPHARSLGALRRGPFFDLLMNASQHGLLDRPIEHFQLLGRGVSWRAAERATQDLMERAERRRPPAIERAPEPLTDWEAVYMRPGTPDEW